MKIEKGKTGRNGMAKASCVPGTPMGGIKLSNSTGNAYLAEPLSESACSAVAVHVSGMH